MEMSRSIGGIMLAGKGSVFGEKHLPLHHCPKQVLVGFTWI